MTEKDDDFLLLHALADDELDPGAALELERRMRAEPPLAAEYERIVALKGAVGRLERPAVTDDFQARIAALASSTPVPPVRTTPRRFVATWQAMAASLVLVAGLSSASTYWLAAPAEMTMMENGLLAGHRRSLLAASPIDVASSDRHTVRPWFDTKLGVAPPTIDLAAAGYPMVGGRVDVVMNRPIPALVYRHGPHLITLAAIPLAAGDTTSTAPVASTSGGYNTVHWREGGFSYWAISDLDAPQLETFVDALRKK